MKITNLFEHEYDITQLVQETPFFNEYKNILTRGVSSRAETTMIPFKERDIPRNTWIPIHNTVNNKSYEKFGLNVRNLLFASTDMNQAAGYGNVVYVFPVDNFRLFFSPVYKDMTVSLRAWLSDVELEIKHFIDTDLGMRTKLTKSEIRTIASPVIRLISVLIKTTNSKIFDIAGALAFMKHHIMETLTTELTKFDIDKSEIEKYVSGFDKSFTEFYKNRFLDPIEMYVQSLKEVSSPSDLDGYDGEVMVYSPDGVYTVTQEDYNWEIG